MHKIVVIGGGGHAKVVVSVLKKTSFSIVGYTDRLDRGTLLQIPFLGNDGVLPEIIRNHRHCKAVLGIGAIDASSARMLLQEQITALGFDFPAIISPAAVMNEDVEIGRGSVMLDGVVVNSGARVGSACIINTNSTVEHDCRIGDNVHIAPGATLSGGVAIGDNCMIGAGATVIQNISICADCVIGAGSTVVKNITMPGTYVGNPVRRIK